MSTTDGMRLESYQEGREENKPRGDLLMHLDGEGVRTGLRAYASSPGPRLSCLFLLERDEES